MRNRLRALQKKTKKVKGFTLIEMVVVIAIIAILILLVVPNLSKQKNKANDRTDEAFKTTLQTQVELSGKDNPTWEDLKKDGLLTEKQAKRAEKYEVNNGVVEEKKN